MKQTHLSSCSGKKQSFILCFFLLLLTLFPSQAFAADGTETMSVEFIVGNLWLLVSAALVFMMHLGFASVEAGFSQGKNTANILFKNVCVISMGILTYALVGFNLMYPGEEFAGKFFGFAGMIVDPGEMGQTASYAGTYTYWTDFIFQAMFAATAATIFSGAVAERIHVVAFLAVASIYVAFCYPIVGFWKWGGGWLDALETPFYDFAGSTLVHTCGGWAALVGVYILGPRIGKYVDGQIKPIYPHSMPLATTGVFLLWFGWYGFNGGSVLSADPAAVSHVFVTTSIAGAAGILGAMVMSLVIIRAFDLSMVLNGALAGLVGITAGADQMGVISATFIGVISGGLCVLSVLFFDKVKLDDPVGAISVHLTCGIFGTLAVGIFGNLASTEQFVSQLIGVASVGVFCVISSFIIFKLVGLVVPLRVSREDEIQGLDISEHGISAYRGLHRLDTFKNKEENENEY